MADRIPFTARIKVVPSLGSGKRMEVVRGRSKEAWLIYQDLAAAAFDTGGTHITLAMPGGGVTLEISGGSDAIGQEYAAAVTPQFGEAPCMVTISGFITISDPTYTDKYTTSPFPTMSIIHCSADSNAAPDNRMVSGPSGAITGWKNTGATSQNNIAAFIIKDLIDDAISATGVVIEVEVKGVRYGRNGFHFNPA